MAARGEKLLQLNTPGRKHGAGSKAVKQELLTKGKALIHIHLHLFLYRVTELPGSILSVFIDPQHKPL